MCIRAVGERAGHGASNDAGTDIFKDGRGEAEDTGLLTRDKGPVVIQQKRACMVGAEMWRGGMSDSSRRSS